MRDIKDQPAFSEPCRARKDLRMVAAKASMGLAAKLRMNALPTIRASLDMTMAVVVVAVATIQRNSIRSDSGIVSLLAKEIKWMKSENSTATMA